MKNVLKNTLLAAIIVALASGGLGYYLGSKSDCTAIKTTQPIPAGASIDTINCNTAYSWIENYGTVAGQMAMELHNAKGTKFSKVPADSLLGGAGWTLPLDGLMNAVQKVDTPRYARAYIALDTITGTFHLILTVVNMKEKNGCPNAGKDSIMPYYFDLVKPCPNLCDVKSKLYINYQDGVKKGMKP